MSEIKQEGPPGKSAVEMFTEVIRYAEWKQDRPDIVAYYLIQSKCPKSLCENYLKNMNFNKADITKILSPSYRIENASYDIICRFYSVGRKIFHVHEEHSYEQYFLNEDRFSMHALIMLRVYQYSFLMSDPLALFIRYFLLKKYDFKLIIAFMEMVGFGPFYIKQIVSLPLLRSYAENLTQLQQNAVLNSAIYFKKLTLTHICQRFNDVRLHKKDYFLTQQHYSFVAKDMFEILTLKEQLFREVEARAKKDTQIKLLDDNIIEICDGNTTYVVQYFRRCFGQEKNGIVTIESIKESEKDSQSQTVEENLDTVPYVVVIYLAPGPEPDKTGLSSATIQEGTDTEELCVSAKFLFSGSTSSPVSETPGQSKSRPKSEWKLTDKLLKVFKTLKSSHSLKPNKKIDTRWNIRVARHMHNKTPVSALEWHSGTELSSGRKSWFLYINVDETLSQNEGSALQRDDENLPGVAGPSTSRKRFATRTTQSLKSTPTASPAPKKPALSISSYSPADPILTQRMDPDPVPTTSSEDFMIHSPTMCSDVLAPRIKLQTTLKPTIFVARKDLPVEDEHQDVNVILFPRRSPPNENDDEIEIEDSSKTAAEPHIEQERCHELKDLFNQIQSLSDALKLEMQERAHLFRQHVPFVRKEIKKMCLSNIFSHWVLNFNGSTEDTFKCQIEHIAKPKTYLTGIFSLQFHYENEPTGSGQSEDEPMEVISVDSSPEAQKDDSSQPAKDKQKRRESKASSSEISDNMSSSQSKPAPQDSTSITMEGDNLTISVSVPFEGEQSEKKPE